jgi:peptide/nickel transport system substrate-binding protein
MGSITVTRNRYYYQAKSGYPYLDGITFKVFADQTALLSALRDHSVDTAWLLPITNLGTLWSMQGVTALPLQDGNWEAAIINMRLPLFKDVRVRQALEYGLNRAAEIQSAWHGLASLIGSDQPPGSTVYSPAITPYPYNPFLAASLLDAAGWHLGADGYRHKGRQILTITYSTSFNKPWRQIDEAQALSDYERLGIQLVIRNYPTGVFENTILPRGQFELAEVVFNNTLDPDDSAAFGTQFTPPQGTNYGAYSNPAFDRLAAQELLTADVMKRAATFQRMQQILHDDVPVLWLYSPDDLAAASTRVHNYQPSPFSMDTWNAWEWWVSRA